MTIGERIKNAREVAGITQVELGERVGVSGVAIMRYEKDQREPRLEQLQRIAAALGVTVNSLLEGETSLNQRVTESIRLEDYLNTLGYEFCSDYEYEGGHYSLCIDRKREKLYLFPLHRLLPLEESIANFAKFSIYELINEGTEIRDVDGQFFGPQPAPPAPEGKDTTPAPEGSEVPQESGE